MTYSDAVHELYVDMSIYGVIFLWFAGSSMAIALTYGFNNRLTKSSLCYLVLDPLPAPTLSTVQLQVAVCMPWHSGSYAQKAN